MDPFLGEIRAVGFNFAPVGWAACDGAILPISQNTALFSLLGTQFGGNGQTNFALPDLRGRVCNGQGNGTGLSAYTVGEEGGAESIGLTTGEMPAHNHGLEGSSATANTNAPTSSVYAVPNTSARMQTLYADNSDTTLNTGAVGVTGSGQAHENRQPSTTLLYIIATQGIFPARN